MIRAAVFRTMATLFGAASIAVATPSTQIWIPSTDIQGAGNLHVGYDAYVSTHSSGILSDAGLTIGVLPAKKIGLEIGLDWRDISGNHEHPGYANVKLGVPEKAFAAWTPALAVGAYDVGFDQATGGYNIVYGLVAKNIGKLGRFSAGGFKGGLGGNEALFTSLSDPSRVDDAGVLLSWDRTITEVSDKLWLAVDFQSGHSGYGAFSFGAAWYFAPNASVIAGYDIYNDKDAIKPTATIQFDFNFK